MTFEIVIKKGYVSINDYFIKLIYFCGFESLAKKFQKFWIFFLIHIFLKSWSWYKQIKFMTCFFACIWFWHLVNYKPKKKFLKSSNNEINSKLSSHTHTHTHTHEIVGFFRTKPKKKRKTKCLETIVNPIRKIIVVKALYYLG